MNKNKENECCDNYVNIYRIFRHFDNNKNETISFEKCTTNQTKNK